MIERIIRIKSIYWILLILALAFALRFLWLGLVPQIYFDEVNYLYDALKYQKGLLSLERESAAVPQHPLLSMLFMQYGIVMFGFNYFGWRIFSVVFGLVSIIAFYFLVKQLFTNRTAIIASFLLSIDFLHIVLSRIAMIEIYVFGFMILGFCFLARSLKHEKSEGLLLAGTFFGLALATKLVALFALLAGFLIYLAISADPKRLLRGFIRLIILPLLLFIVVSLLLNLSGGMNPLTWAQFEVKNFEYHQMFSYHHPFNAAAWTWPFLLRSTPFFGAQMGPDLTGYIIAFGNPAVYWLLVPVMIYLLYEFQKKRNTSVLFILIGFICAYLPWLVYEYLGKMYIIYARGLFFYYFLPAVPFYLAGLAYVLDNLFNNKVGKIAVVLYLILVAALFLFFSPLLYGLPVNPDYLKWMIWIKGWVH